MTLADAFLQDILAHPDDDAPRLIYADWLEERGHASAAARAEFIRVQCALAKTNRNDRSADDLVRHEARLLMEHGEEWAEPLRELIFAWNFRRGFIHEVAAAAEPFLQQAERIFRSAPIQHVQLQSGGWNRSPAGVAALADCSYLVHLRSLTLSDNQLGSSGIRSLAVSEYLTELTALDLAGNNLGDAGIRALVAAPFFPRLIHLDLSRNSFGLSGVRTLIAALRRLARKEGELRMQRLVLSGNRHATTARQLLASVPPIWRVVRW